MLFVFVGGTPILIGYSKGYRLDDALSLTSTGGIYINSDVSNASVYLDNTFVDRSGAFLKNTLIQDLAPNKSYVVRMQKAGYRSWVKRLPVLPNLVTEARVLMLPEEFDWTPIRATSTVAVNSSLVSATTTQSVANPEYVDMLDYFENDKDQFAVGVATTTYEFVHGQRVATTTTTFEIQFPTWLEGVASSTHLADKTMVRERDGIVAWLEDGNLHTIWARVNDAPPYYLCTSACTDKLVIDWQEPILRYEFYPNRSDVVVLSTQRGIYAVELDNRSQRNIQPIMEGSGYDFRIFSDGTIGLFDGSVFQEASL